MSKTGSKLLAIAHLGEIDLDALAANFQIVRKLVGRNQIMAVVKANAYGMGRRCAAGSPPKERLFGVASRRRGLN